MILRFLVNFQHYSQCWECLTAGNHPFSPEKNKTNPFSQFDLRKLHRSSLSTIALLPISIKHIDFLCNFSYYSQSWEWLTAVNHPTVKLVPTLNWTPKFPNGKLDPHSIYQIWKLETGSASQYDVKCNRYIILKVFGLICSLTCFHL